MAVAPEIWDKLDRALSKGRVRDCIDLLEAEISRLDDPEDIATVARRLGNLLAPESPAQDLDRACQYYYLAGQAYVAMGRMAPSLATLSLLKKMPAGANYAKKLHRRISETFSLPASKSRNKGADDHLPPPTPYKEFTGIVSFETDDDVVQRMQWTRPSAKKAPLFSWLKASEVSDLIQLAFVRELPPGAVLFREGDRSEAFYVVAEGEMQLTNSRGVEVTFREGDCFGELALLAKLPRTATLKALTECRLIEFSEKLLRECFEENPSLESKVMHFYELRLFVNAALRHPLFAGLTSADLEKLWEEMTSIRVPKGRALFTNPSDADRFYLISKGHLVAYSNDQVVAHYRPGDFFGWSPAIDKIVPDSECILLECHKLSFGEYLDRLPNLRRAFEGPDRYDFFRDSKTQESVLD